MHTVQLSFARRAFACGRPPMRKGVMLLFAAIFLALGVAMPRASAQTCPFDDGNSTLTNDGLVLTRYALGIRGSPLLANTDFAAADPALVESHIACPACGLRITDDRDGLNNPIFTAADATIISRKLAGLSGDALTNGLALGSGARNTPAAVNSFLLAGCGNTGGTVTNITAGTGLAVSPNATGGSITTTGTIQIATGGVGNAQLASNAVTISKIAAGAVGINQIADASVSQSKLAEFNSPTAAGQFLSTTGPSPGGQLRWADPPALSCVAGADAALTVNGGSQDCATSACPAGYTVTGGGTVGGSTNTFSFYQYANGASGNGWRVCAQVGGSAAAEVNFTVRARCCKVD